METGTIFEWIRTIFDGITGFFSSVFGFGDLIRDNMGGFTSFLSSVVNFIPVEFWTALVICASILIIGIIFRYLGG